MDYKMFEAKCMECGKEIYSFSADGKGFCSRMCETNYKYRMSHRDPIDGYIPTPEEARTYGAKRDLPKSEKGSK